MADTSLRIAVVGLGQWGPNHVRTFSSLADAEVVVAVDPRREARERLGLSHPQVPCVAELAPVPRDVADYFIPMRQFAADHLPWQDPAWINLGSGCGEAWFANPETGVLYPPAWLHVVAPTPWALTAEIALHLEPVRVA